MAQPTILVVEDEDQVRTLLVRLLQKRGYEVLQAENGRKALEVAQGVVEKLALVITDLVMPEMGGAALLRELRKQRSGLPFLCMTGYTQKEVASLDGLHDGSFIEKPFSPATFLEQVDALINGGASSSS